MSVYRTIGPLVLLVRGTVVWTILESISIGDDLFKIFETLLAFGLLCRPLFRSHQGCLSYFVLCAVKACPVLSKLQGRVSIMESAETFESTY